MYDWLFVILPHASTLHTCTGLKPYFIFLHKRDTLIAIALTIAKSFKIFFSSVLYEHLVIVVFGYTEEAQLYTSMCFKYARDVQFLHVIFELQNEKTQHRHCIKRQAYALYYSHDAPRLLSQIALDEISLPRQIWLILYDIPRPKCLLPYLPYLR